MQVLSLEPKPVIYFQILLSLWKTVFGNNYCTWLYDISVIIYLSVFHSS